MGGQQSGSRQHLYVCLAGAVVIISFSPGCAHDRPAPEPRASSEPEQQPDCQRHLKAVRTEIESGDFAAAIRAYKEMLTQPMKERRDDLALFDLGLLYSHYANPRKDYKASLLYFSRLIREHPGSPLAEEAKIWVNLLETMEKTQQVDIELEERTKALSK